jgi:hypothetical protein
MSLIYKTIKRSEPRRLTAPWASTASYRDSFTFYIGVQTLSFHKTDSLMSSPETNYSYRNPLIFYSTRRVLLRHCFWPLLYQNILPISPYILSRVRGSVTDNNEFWIGWLDLLTPSLYNLSKLQAIQRYRRFTQFTVHRYIRTRILCLH